jgi:hypothetical protein
MNAQPMQFLIPPEATEHPHVAVLRVLARGCWIGDPGVRCAVRIKPAARGCLGQQTFAYGKNYLRRQQLADEEVPVAIEPAA